MDGQLRNIIGWRRGGHLFTIGVAIVCGLAGAFGAVVFRLLIRTVQGLFFEGTDGVTAVFEEGVLAEASDPRDVARLMTWFDHIKPEAANRVLRHWRRNPNYLEAIEQLEESRDGQD